MVETPCRVIAAACDGACSGNPGPGGWGALLRFEDGSLRELGGSDPATTNNRMELCAALALLEALRILPRHPGLVIRTDSRYLIDGLQKWLPGWKRKGWRTASGGPVLNRDLWERLEQLRLPDVPLVHVRGHSGDVDNDRCDAIAVAFARGQRPRLAAGPPANGSAGSATATAVNGPGPGASSGGLPQTGGAGRVATGDHGAQGYGNAARGTADRGSTAAAAAEVGSRAGAGAAAGAGARATTGKGIRAGAGAGDGSGNGSGNGAGIGDGDGSRDRNGRKDAAGDGAEAVCGSAGGGSGPATTRAAAGDHPGRAGSADPAPESLRQLLSRLELADRLARGGHALSLPELAQLVELPLRQLQERREAWIWRDWRVLPQGAGRWRLERDAGGWADR